MEVCEYKISGKKSGEEASETIRQLQTLPHEEAFELFGTIRNSASSSNLPRTTGSAESGALELSPSLSEQRLLRGLLPSTRSSLEFELAVRHPIAYPALYPAQLNSESHKALLKPRRLALPPFLR